MSTSKVESYLIIKMECLKENLFRRWNIFDVPRKRFSNASNRQKMTIKKTGRKKVTLPRDDKSIIYQSIRSRRKTSLELCADFNEASTLRMSTRTVRWRLVKYSLKGCKARKKLWVSKANTKKMSLVIKNHPNQITEGKSYGMI